MKEVAFDTTVLQLALYYLEKKNRIVDGQFDAVELLEVSELILQKVDLINRQSNEKRIRFEDGRIICSEKLLERKVKLVGGAKNLS